MNVALNYGDAEPQRRAMAKETYGGNAKFLSRLQALTQVTHNRHPYI